MIKHVTERETALEAELHALKREDRHIRRLLCIAVADRPYMDDGEAHDQEIDYLREPAGSIESKMYQRNLRKFQAKVADIEGKAEVLAIAIYEAVNDDTSTRTPWAYLNPGEWDKWRRAANLAAGAQPEVVKWGVDWGTHGDRSCVSIVKQHTDGTLEVVATEYQPTAGAQP